VKIFDVHDAGRAEGGGFGSHGEYFMEKQPREAMRKCRGGAQAKETLSRGNIDFVIDSRVRRGQRRTSERRPPQKAAATIARGAT
jgi:hypothetical protein